MFSCSTKHLVRCFLGCEPFQMGGCGDGKQQDFEEQAPVVAKRLDKV